MMVMSKEKPKQSGKPSQRKRHAIFLSLDEATAAKLKAFIERQRVKPTDAAVALTALTEFLNRESTD